MALVAILSVVMIVQLVTRISTVQIGAAACEWTFRLNKYICVLDYTYVYCYLVTLVNMALQIAVMTVTITATNSGRASVQRWR